MVKVHVHSTGVCGWTVGWIIKRYRNLVLAAKKILAASYYTISVFVRDADVSTGDDAWAVT